ncbi:hypothetical protein WDL1P1_00329 (plasmid) [Variovorax sp. WDL1]|nr:hypothetical protein WDL1P1_00329 [Variovorax sp. WDL1]
MMEPLPVCGAVTDLLGQLLQREGFADEGSQVDLDRGNVRFAIRGALQLIGLAVIRNSTTPAEPSARMP